MKLRDKGRRGEGKGREDEEGIERRKEKRGRRQERKWIAIEEKL